MVKEYLSNPLRLEHNFLIRFVWDKSKVKTLFTEAFFIALYISCLIFFFFSRLYNPSGFRPVQLSLSILSRKVLQSAVAIGMSNSQLGGEPGI
jgi:hypothetical protein